MAENSVLRNGKWKINEDVTDSDKMEYYLIAQSDICDCVSIEQYST